MEFCHFGSEMKMKFPETDTYSCDRAPSMSHAKIPDIFRPQRIITDGKFLREDVFRIIWNELSSIKRTITENIFGVVIE